MEEYTEDNSFSGLSERGWFGCPTKVLELGHVLELVFLFYLYRYEIHSRKQLRFIIFCREE